MSTRREFLKAAAVMPFIGLVKQVGAATDRLVDIDQIPENDTRTFSLLQRGETEGVPHFDDPVRQEFLRRLRPDMFHDLIAMIAMFRPGPLAAGMVDAYIDRKHGREIVAYQHPFVKEILSETHGVLLYQEQVMEIFNRLGGIELPEGHKLLKAISMKKKEIIDTQHARFMAGARERGIEKETASSFFVLMVFFGGLCICKAHATTEAWLAYQGAYLKAHYPAEFAEAIKLHSREMMVK
jgi:DNA polymerase-3 subunit alpha